MQKITQSVSCKALLLMLTVVLTGCANHVRVSGDWAEDANREQSFTRVLVIGLAPNAGARCDFESFLATQIRATGAEARASCNMMKTSEPVTVDSVVAVANEYGADAVLTTVLVAAEQAAEAGGTNETRGGMYFKAQGTGYASSYYRGGYGRYGVPVVYGEFRVAPVITSVEGEATIRSMLYSTRDESLVYTLDTTAKDLNSRDNALASITPPIAKRLKSAGLLR